MNELLLSTGLGLLLSVVGTPVLIRILARRGYGQVIRDDGPQSHQGKKGTPTMGGIAFVVAAVLAYGLTKLITGTGPTASGLLVLFLMTGLGLIGFLDDYIKIAKKRSLGLRAKAKLVGQCAVAVVFAVLALQFADEHGVTPASTSISFVRDFGWELGPVLFVVWAYLIISGTSNGVNLTDGLDGLAAGATVMVLGAYTFIGMWQSNLLCSAGDIAGGCYVVRDPFDLAVVASSLMGAVFGFLWWNTAPAKIFMGDTGAFALGGALAGLAILSRTQLLLPLLGALFVLVTLSVVTQVGYFKLSGGKRVFRMAPIQHHYELKGWSEGLVVVRFWIVQSLCVALGIGAVYSL
ncbi:phospho-N-acetylmuramoyl-pentapeptide-transferase [Streptomyces bambusae]|uniref:phospho-N-acetylmuramoyl-pentapeptide- transferase n=1 Tax=Streptomyces bambusae TaxID=1550616 RepID=UPI001CFE1BF8|nr:phospho-N-acetylmuramoyl-pentapeptide-transferase [Streptomyces bambusae]MCB5164632.1 phospho-N-acetylmuramoyl-pentapeptide-transferase [Streptomyces bambusae]